MEEHQIKTKRIVIISIIIVVILFTVLSIVSVINKRAGMIIIDNLDQNISDFPSEDKTAIQTSLYSYVQNQNKIKNISDKSYYHGKIRDNSFVDETKSIENHSIHSTEFIIDLESLQYSYRVAYSWSTEDLSDAAIDLGPVIIYCLSSDEAIYEDFSCAENPSVSEKLDDIYSAKSVISMDCWFDIETGSETAPSGLKLIIYYHPSDEDYNNNTVDSSLNTCVNDVKKSLTAENITLGNYELVPTLRYFYYY